MSQVIHSDRVADLLRPYLKTEPDRALIEKLNVYLELLLKWNAKTNLTAIRDPEVIIQRHFGESMFLAERVPSASQTFLDLGSGAGFPGIPTQLLRPELTVTLAESQNKKASFLREVVRILGISSRVWAARAEGLVERFDMVALRAVDNMEASLPIAAKLLADSGRILVLTAEDQRVSLLRLLPGFHREKEEKLPLTGMLFQIARDQFLTKLLW